LGYDKSRHLQPKIKYSSLTSYKPNEIWCADVMILKTADGKKHYIHFLMDHYSKMILGYSVENSSSPKAIKNLLKEAYLKHKNETPITLVTDAGVENVNNTVQEFLSSTNPDIKHLIAQKDIPFSNSRIDVEPVFAQLKRNNGFRRFSLKGLEKVELEFGLKALGHNLRKKIAA
jgi:putative transposase